MHTDDISLNDFIQLQYELKPTISIEVGAYDGEYSRVINTIVKNTYAFEASRPVYERFLPLMSNIEYINKAISDHNGTITFNVDARFDPADIGHNSIKNPSYLLADRTTYPVDIECVSLDSYFKDIKNDNIALWIDAEGANREVFMGATNLLKMVSSIYIEVEHIGFWEDIWLRDDVINYLDAQGFYLYAEYDAYDSQTNCIFLRK